MPRSVFNHSSGAGGEAQCWGDMVRRQVHGLVQAGPCRLGRGRAPGLRNCLAAGGLRWGTAPSGPGWASAVCPVVRVQLLCEAQLVPGAEERLKSRVCRRATCPQVWEKQHQESTRAPESRPCVCFTHPSPTPPLQVLWQDLPPISKPHEAPEDTHRGAAVQVGARPAGGAGSWRTGRATGGTCAPPSWPLSRPAPRGVVKVRLPEGSHLPTQKGAQEQPSHLPLGCRLAQRSQAQGWSGGGSLSLTTTQPHSAPLTTAGSPR